MSGYALTVARNGSRLGSINERVDIELDCDRALSEADSRQKTFDKEVASREAKTEKAMLAYRKRRAEYVAACCDSLKAGKEGDPVQQAIADGKLAGIESQMAAELSAHRDLFAQGFDATAVVAVDCGRAKSEAKALLDGRGQHAVAQPRNGDGTWTDREAGKPSGKSVD